MKATYQEVLKQLTAREFAPIYILHGKEPLYIDKITNYAENCIIDEADRDFNQAVFYGKDTEPDEVIASAKEFPFGVEKRIVIVKEAQNWPKFDLVRSYAHNPAPDTVLFICYKYGEMKAGDLKSLDKNAVIFDSPQVPLYQLGKWVENCAKEHGFVISSASAQLLAEHIGNDLSRIDNEFEKLKILIPAGSDITNDIIEKHIGISKQYNIYELRDALVERNELKAFKIVSVFAQNPKASPIIGTIAALFNYYNAMLKYSLAPSKTPDDLKQIFGYNYSPQKLAREANIASRFSRDSLLKIISTLREFDAKAKGVDTTAEESELYKELIYRILH